MDLTEFDPFDGGVVVEVASSSVMPFLNALMPLATSPIISEILPRPNSSITIRPTTIQCQMLAPPMAKPPTPEHSAQASLAANLRGGGGENKKLRPRKATPRHRVSGMVNGGDGAGARARGRQSSLATSGPGSRGGGKRSSSRGSSSSRRVVSSEGSGTASAVAAPPSTKPAPLSSSSPGRSAIA